jgi:hypothetical protein
MPHASNFSGLRKKIESSSGTIFTIKQLIILINLLAHKFSPTLNPTHCSGRTRTRRY